MDWYSLTRPFHFELAGWPTVGLALVLALGVAALGFRLTRRLMSSQWLAQNSLGFALRRADMAMQGIVPALLALFILGLAPDDLEHIELARRIAGVVLIMALTVAATQAANAVGDWQILRHPFDVADNLRARQVHTRVKVVVRSLNTLLLVVGVAAALMTFPVARKFGVSLLASAGAAGVIVGLAAKSVLGNLAAGLQLALAQPIRIDDVLVVEGEFGRVEEINSTYVVIRIWDDRRLVVPLNWFMEHPFQNWTRTGSAVTSSVFLWLDFRTPLEPLRAELERLVRESSEWDRRFCNLQVVDADQTAMKVRALLTTNDSGKGWDLQVRVREGLIAFMQREYPHCLPRSRTAFEVEADGPVARMAAAAPRKRESAPRGHS